MLCTDMCIFCLILLHIYTLPSNYILALIFLRKYKLIQIKFAICLIKYLTKFSIVDLQIFIICYLVKFTLFLARIC